MKDSELKALISLLDDNDHEVHAHVVNQLKRLGPDIIPRLEKRWESENDFNPLLQERIEELVHDIQFEFTLQAFAHWFEESDQDLLDGVLLIAKFQYPEIDVDRCKNEVKKIFRDCWIEMHDDLTAFELVNVINQIIYRFHGFKGVTTDPLNIQHIYLNLVLDSKRGNPLGLGLLNLCIARMLDLPIYGVDLPHHFVLGFSKKLINDFDTPSANRLRSYLVFYMNPANQGMIFTKEEIDLYLDKSGLEKKPEFYAPLSDLDCVKRLLYSLLHIYQKQSNEVRVEEVRRFIEVIQ